MTSTKRTTLRTRVSQCLTAIALMAGIAVGAAAIAGATPMDWDKYYRCVIRGGYIDECCWPDPDRLIHGL